MSTMLMIGRSGAQAFQNNINVVASNISNVNTTGYKRNDVSFKDLIHTEKRLPLMNGAEVSETFNQGFGVRSDVISEDFKQGSLIETGVANNYAISGNGYFGVLNPETNQIMLTRDGSFAKNAQGQLVDSNGNVVMMKEIVNEDGTITTQPLLYSPNQTANLTKISDNYYTIDAQNLISENQNPQGYEFGDVHQGYLESSNVDLGMEMTDLIIAQRAYSMNLKAIQAADETLQIINQLR